MSDFIHMGGYGAYVWPAYLLSAFVLCAMSVATARAYHKHKRRLHQLEESKISN